MRTTHSWSVAFGCVPYLKKLDFGVLMVQVGSHCRSHQRRGYFLFGLDRGTWRWAGAMRAKQGSIGAGWEGLLILGMRANTFNGEYQAINGLALGLFRDWAEMG